MNRERLQHAIKVIEKLKDAGVQSDDDTDTGDRLNLCDWGRTTNCGTVACLGGWFTLDPTFREQGLRSERDNDRGPFPDGHAPLFGGRRGYDALELFFELHRIECRHIFAGWNTNSLDDGVERIRALLDGKDVHELFDLREKQRERRE